MSQPDYVVCIDCETPVYTFEWADGRITEALCPTCGNDDPAGFATEEDIEDMVRVERHDPDSD